MSTYKPFTVEELETLAVWRLPEIGLNGRPVARAPVEATPPAVAEAVSSSLMVPTAEQIEAMQKQAYDEAFGQGRDEGYREGKAKGYEDGKRQGYQEGHAEGRAVGEAELAALQQDCGERLQAVLAQLQAPFTQLDDAVERELVALAVAIARQVVRRELRIDPQLVLASVRGAVGALPSASRDITVYLNPDDVDLVRNSLTLAESEAKWKLLADPTVGRGGCRVVAEPSVVDAGVERRLALAVAQVLGDERDALA